MSTIDPSYTNSSTKSESDKVPVEFFRRLSRFSPFRILVILCCLLLIIQPCQSEAEKIAPLYAPVEMDSSKFLTLINDPQRKFWFLKFYAQYSEPSIRLAPVLGKVAKQVKDKMAVGKLDCTRFRPTCAKYGIRGYPTLKYAINGELYDYLGKPDEASIVAFAERMTSPPVVSVASMEGAERIAQLKTDHGLAFVGVDTKPKVESELYKIFEAVARRHQATAHFLWLDQQGSTYNKPAVMRLEPGVVSPRVWTSTESTSAALDRWILSQNVPSLSIFDGPDEMMRSSKLGRPLVICVLDIESQNDLNDAKAHMMDYIQSASGDKTDKYYFGVLGGKWNVFLRQFGIQPKSTPQFLMFDATQSSFWQNTTYNKLPEFLKAVQDGDITPQKKRSSVFGDTGFHWIAELFFDYYPLSLGAVMILICLPVVLFTNPPPKPTPIPRCSKQSKKKNR